MNDFKTPASKRKGKSPTQKKDRVNEYVIGKHSAVKLVASIERAGHQTMVSRLKYIRRTMVLTSAQAKAVNEELQWRMEQCRNLTRIIENSQRAIDFQCAKPTAQDRPRTAVIVPGPNGSKMRHPQQTASGNERRDTGSGLVHMMGDNYTRRTSRLNLQVKASPSWFPGLAAPSQSSDPDKDEDRP